MSIEPKCYNCKKELVGYGALLISPPLEIGAEERPDPHKVEKFHICTDCFCILMDILHGVLKVVKD